MLAPITIRYPARSAPRGLAAAHVADLFGLAPGAPPEAVAAGVALDVRPGDLVLVTGPSGAGKSSLLRAAGAQLGAVDVAALPLPDVPLVDALPGPVGGRLAALAGCGLAEPRVVLRPPAELSDGQRHRFRIAYALARAEAADATRPAWLLLDEFAAVLDRPLAKVVAFNLRKLVTRAGVGALCGTTHDDLAADLSPDLLVRCHGDGRVDQGRPGAKKKRVSFAGELWLSAGTKADWAYFARWHYRGHALGPVRRVTVLWHGDEPVGVCVFGAPAAVLGPRARFFGLPAGRTAAGLAALNDRVWALQRVVLHPTYRGAGVGAEFVRRACELCPVPWVETLSALGHANPVFERAGFVRAGTVRNPGRAAGPNPVGRGAYGGRRGRLTPEAAARSRWSEPAYYVFDNRARVSRG